MELQTLLAIIPIIAVGIISMIGFYFFSWNSSKNKLNDKILRKKNEVQSMKQELRNKLSKLNISQENVAAITDLSMADLQKKISSGELKAVDVLHMYQMKALALDLTQNSLCEPLLESEEIAEALDQLPLSKRGILHGIPISVKEMIAVKGHTSTCGLVNLAFDKMTSDAVLIQVLKRQGAVPFFQTNMAQIGASMDNANPLYGETVNAHNSKRTCGGSSGGEGALVGGGGSILGFGTDVGGSIRIPASHNGAYGFKPTAHRLSLMGLRSPTGIYGSVRATIGPLARDVDSCVLAMRVILSPDTFQLDGTLPSTPFCENDFKPKKLRIGMYTQLDDCLDCVPTVTRAVTEAKEVLIKMGHEVVDFKVPDISLVKYDLYSRNLDSGKLMRECLKDDVTVENITTNLRMARLPKFIVHILIFFSKYFSPLLARIYGILLLKQDKLADCWILMKRIREYRHRFLSVMEEDELDAIICPVAPFPALPLGASQYLTMAAVYTFLYNTIDFPAGSVPCTQVTEKDLQLLDSQPIHTDLLRRYAVNLQKDSVGMPVGVQCVAKPWKDEICLRLMKDLEQGLSSRSA